MTVRPADCRPRLIPGRVNRFCRRTWRACHAALLFAWALLPPGVALLHAQPPSDSTISDSAISDNAISNKASSPAAESTAPESGEQALARLRELGASVFDSKFDTHTEIEIWANIDSAARYIAIDLGQAWKGTDADLATIGDVLSLGDVELGIGLDSVSPLALAELKLPKPLAALRLDSTDQRLGQLSVLPPCRLLALGSGPLTAAHARHMVELAADVESLTLFGDRSQNSPQGLNDEDLAQLAELTKLKRLQVSCCPITDVGLKHLARMKSLESLRLESCFRLTESDLAGLADASTLRTLEIDWPLSAAAVANIARLDSLETLTFHIGDLKPDDFEPLARLAHLQKLSVEKDRAESGRFKRSPAERLAETPQGNSIARVASQMPNLQTLRIDAAIDREGLESVVAAKRLQSLTLEPIEVDDRALERVAGLTQLKRLCLLGEGKLTDQGLAHLRTLTALVELRLPRAAVADAALAHLAGLTALEELSLPDANITAAGLARLERSNKLSDLSLPGSPIDDAGCRLLPKYFPHLTTLDLRRSKISDEGMDSIADLPELYCLILDRTAITNAGLAKLGRMKRLRLRLLSLSGTAVDGEGIGALKTTLPGLNVAFRQFGVPAVAMNDIYRDPKLEVPEFTPDSDDVAQVVAPESPPARPSSAAAGSPGEKALARLIELGALVFDEESTTAERGIRVSLTNQNERFKWKGTDADLALLADIQTLGELSLEIDFQLVSPQEIPELRLERPLGTLYLEHISGEIIAKLTRLPLCRGCALDVDEWTPATVRHLAKLIPGVEHLRFTCDQEQGWREGITDDQLAELTGLENLADLELVGSPITEVGLGHLAKLKRLRRLFLWGCPELQESELTAMPGFKALRRLEWMEPVSAGGLASIAGVGSLETLLLNVADLEPADVLPLAHLRRVHTLTLTFRDAPDDLIETDEQETREKVPVGDAIARALGKMPALRILSLEMPLSNKGLAALAAPGKLQAIRLHLDQVDDRSLALVAGLPHLRQLRLRGTAKFSDEAMAPLAALTALVDLSLPAGELTDAALAHLAPLTKLQYLNLPGGKITGSGLAALDRCQGLKQLDLSRSSFDDAGCQALRRFAALETLCLFDTQLTDAGLESIAQLPNLTKLYLYDTAITDAGLLKLSPLKKLREIYAMGIPLTQGGLDAMRTLSPNVWIIADSVAGDEDDENVIYFPAE